MKKPRIEAFDTTNSVKQLKSPLDNMPTIEKPHPAQADTPKEDTRTAVPPVRDVRRKIKSRQPYDIYEDQAETLKKLSIEDRMSGGMGSMSAMVREALDDYIAKKTGSNSHKLYT